MIFNQIAPTSPRPGRYLQVKIGSLNPFTVHFRRNTYSATPTHDAPYSLSIDQVTRCLTSFDMHNQRRNIAKQLSATDRLHTRHICAALWPCAHKGTRDIRHKAAQGLHRRWGKTSALQGAKVSATKEENDRNHSQLRPYAARLGKPPAKFHVIFFRGKFFAQHSLFTGGTAGGPHTYSSPRLFYTQQLWQQRIFHILEVMTFAGKMFMTKVAILRISDAPPPRGAGQFG